MTLPPLTQIPPHVAAVADYEALARERMSDAAWAYFAGGAGDEWTLRENAAAFDRLPLRTRALRDMRGATTRTALLGCDLAAPILLAPVAFQRMAHPDGELATVLAAGAIDVPMVVSTQASLPVEAIAEQAAAPLWFQLYIQPDRDFTEALVRRAEAAGYRALVVTVDAPATGMRWREQRAGFALPPVVEAVAGAAPVLVDGGIRRGADILRALALGASAALVGRAWIFALAAAGAVGVAHVLRMLRAELELAMALTGCPDIASIDRGVLAARA